MYYWFLQSDYYLCLLQDELIFFPKKWSLIYMTDSRLDIDISYSLERTATD